MRFLLIPLLLLSSQTGDPVIEIQANTKCSSYRSTHHLVRNDVLSQLNADRKNLGTCEESLDKGQAELRQAQETLRQAKRDLETLRAAALKQKESLAELRAQKRVLERHITKLEEMTCPDPTVGQQLQLGWEEVDGIAGLGVGYVIGTGQCIGLAWVFNQPDFQR